MSPGARAALRLGAYQLLFMRIPRHAAVSESVDLATPRERGFVNAILRKIADDPPTPPTGSTDEDIFIRTGMSPWAVRELRRILGDDEAEVAAEAFGERGLLSLRTNTCSTTVEAFVRGLRASGHTPRPAQLASRLRASRRRRSVQAPRVRTGLVRGAGPGVRVRRRSPRSRSRATACSTPVRRPAGRRHTWRASSASRGPSSPPTFDPSAPPSSRAPRNGSACPCMSWRRTRPGPAVRRRRSIGSWSMRRARGSGRPDGGRSCCGGRAAATSPRLARLQVAIASAAADRLRPGGRLVYSVCTFPRAETDAACDALVRHRPELEPVEIDGPDGSAARVRLWPHRHGSDGMFVAAFRKRPDRGAVR